ncbi:MAG: ATP-binding protein [Acidobacteriota bacterium]
MSNRDKISINFTNNLKYTEFTVFILTFLKNILTISDDDMFKIEISLREVINNAIIHGNKSNPEKRVYLDFEWEKDLLILTITDENDTPVDFNQILKKIEERDLLSFNGRGILIMRTYMDNVKFSNIKGGTRIVLEKHV